MNRSECVQLVAYIQSLAPHQHLGDGTALAWHEIPGFGDLPYVIARKAAAEVAARQSYIAPTDIIAMTKRLRRAVGPAAEARADEIDDTPPAAVEQYLAWMRGRQNTIRRIADEAIAAGQYDPRLLAIETGDAA